VLPLTPLTHPPTHSHSLTHPLTHSLFLFSSRSKPFPFNPWTPPPSRPFIGPWLAGGGAFSPLLFRRPCVQTYCCQHFSALFRHVLGCRSRRHCSRACQPQCWGSCAGCGPAPLPPTVEVSRQRKLRVRVKTKGVVKCSRTSHAHGTEQREEKTGKADFSHPTAVRASGVNGSAAG
jgi:hypothetical protein